MGKKNEPSGDDFGSALKFDPTFNGPLRKRSCTDVLCLLIFLAFLVCWGVVAFFAFKYGDPARLLVPTDSEGYRCGIDEIVKNKSNLLFFELNRCANPGVIANGCDTPQVCVEKCPNEAFLAEQYRLNGDLPADARRLLICTYDVDKDTIRTTQQMYSLIKADKCAPWYLPSTPIQGRCVPIKDNSAGTVILATLSELSNLAKSFISSITNNQRIQEVPALSLPPAPNGSRPTQVESSYRALFAQNNIGQMMVDDLSKSWGWIVGMLVLAMVCCMIFIVLMRWFAGVMVWISLIAVHVLLAYSIYACWAKYSELKDQPPPPTSGGSLEDQAKALLAMKGTWLAFLIIASILLAVVFLMTIFLRSRIRIAIALIGEASKAVGSVKSTLVFPLVPWALQCLVIAWTVCLILYLAGSGKEVFKVTGVGENSTCSCLGQIYSDGSVCDLAQFTASCKQSLSGCANADCRFYRFVTESYVDYLHAVNIFGFFWALFFVSALGEMALASTFATWYWTYNKDDVPFFTLTESVGRTFRYNLGTVAFGSLILAICRMIRVVLEFVSNQLAKYDNMFVKCLMCCCKCFFWCLENFIKFINRNAYIMCAVHGKNFCASAKDAFNLLMRNVVRVFVLDKVTDFLLLLGKLTITTGICALAFFVFDKQVEIPVDGIDVPTLNYSLMPVFVVAFGTYFIATIFFGVYAMAVDTLFLCFLEDSERNDGSIEKPYFMSKSLRKILDKKNKKAK